jgi:hypothetical protein
MLLVSSPALPEVPRRHAHQEIIVMARSLGNVIADSLGISLSYGERMLKGVSAERFGRFACPGGVEVVSNHPAFIYGHLSLYAPKVLVQIGCPTPAVPEGFEIAFAKDAVCRDDADADLLALHDADPACVVACLASRLPRREDAGARVQPREPWEEHLFRGGGGGGLRAAEAALEREWGTGGGAAAPDVATKGGGRARI